MSPILAHLVTTGLGPIYDGIGHLFVSLEDLVPVVILAVFAGQRGPWAARHSLFILPIAWLAGGFIGLNVTTQPTFPWECLSFLLLGLLVATDLRPPKPMLLTLPAMVGIQHGLLNGIAMANLGKAVGALEIIGIACALFVLVALVSAFVIWLRWDWTKIAVRVAGAWVVAMGLLWLGWAIRMAG